MNNQTRKKLSLRSGLSFLFIIWIVNLIYLDRMDFSTLLIIVNIQMMSMGVMFILIAYMLELGKKGKE